MVDPDLDPPAGGILAASLPIGGRLDHRPRQQRLRRIRLIALDPAAALDQLRMKRRFIRPASPSNYPPRNP
jgi:hypothetical protein